MSESSPSRLLVASLVLNVATLAGIGWLVVRDGSESEDYGSEESSQLEDLTDEIAGARLEMRSQIQRLESAVSKLGADRPAPGSDAAVPRFDSGADLGRMTSDELLARWQHVCEVLSRHRHDPLERESVEVERGRIEEQMRARGDDCIASIEKGFTDVGDSWLQTRLLKYLVEPIGSARGREFGKRVFEDLNIVPGLRLVGFEVAMAGAEGSEKDAMVGQLIALLDHPDPTFDRRELILTYLKQNPDSRAVPTIVRLVTEPSTALMLRNFGIQALGSYPAPESIATLEELARTATLGALRIEALRSLHKITGEDILDFARKLREQIPPEDSQMLNFLDNLEALYPGSK